MVKGNFISHFNGSYEIWGELKFDTAAGILEAKGTGSSYRPVCESIKPVCGVKRFRDHRSRWWSVMKSCGSVRNGSVYLQVCRILERIWNPDYCLLRWRDGVPSSWRLNTLGSCWWATANGPWDGPYVVCRSCSDAVTLPHSDGGERWAGTASSQRYLTFRLWEGKISAGFAMMTLRLPTLVCHCTDKDWQKTLTLKLKRFKKSKMCLFSSVNSFFMPPPSVTDSAVWGPQVDDNMGPSATSSFFKVPVWSSVFELFPVVF